MASVLVVDDEPDIRYLVRELLERAGHDVVEAGDGTEALRIFFSSRPDLVVLDVSMPGLDGWGTLERIRDLSDVPVVMLTAQAQEHVSLATVVELSAINAVVQGAALATWP